MKRIVKTDRLHHKMWLASSVAAVLLAGCVSGPSALSKDTPSAFKPEVVGAQERRDAMVGSWHGEFVVDSHTTRRWLIHRYDDGTYRVQHRIVRTGPAAAVAQANATDADTRLSQAEYGVWGISGSVYYTIMQGWIAKNGARDPADPRDAYYYNAYQVTSLQPDEFTYRNVETGNTYTVRRVGADFAL